MQFSELKEKVEKESIKDQWLVELDGKIIGNDLPLDRISVEILKQFTKVTSVRVLNIDDQEKSPQPWIDVEISGTTKAPFSKPTLSPRGNSESTQVLASLVDRFIGAFLDGLILVVPILVCFFVMIVVRGNPEETFELTIGERVLFILLSWTFFLAINGYLLYKHGQTVGKKIAGTRIVAVTDGQLLPFSKVFGLRYLIIGMIAHIPIIGSWFYLIDILFIFRKDRRCIHDLFAGTKVVNAN